MEEWGSGQIALFETLSAICDRVGPENAAGTNAPPIHTAVRTRTDRELSTDLAATVRRSNGQKFSAELQQLKEKASRVDELQNENTRLQTDLESALLQVRTSREVAPPPEKVIHDHETTSVAPENGKYIEIERYETLATKYNMLCTNHREVSSARQEMETKLRKTRNERQDWINYANSLAKRVQKLETKLANHNLLDKGSFEKDAPDDGEKTDTSPAPAPQNAATPAKQADTTMSRKLAISPGGSDFEGETFVATPDGDAAGPLPVPLPALSRTIEPHSESSPIQHYSSTQGDPDDIPDSNDLPLPANDNNSSPGIKHEPSSDPPVVLYTRSVKKSTKASKSPQKLHCIKHETLTSSPLRILGSQHNDSPQSVDLDDVGEKVKTPKKRKRPSNIIPQDQILRDSVWWEAEMEQSNLTTPGQPSNVQSSSARAIRRIGLSSVLQPMSPNTHILPRTSMHRAKRIRIEDRVRGAEMFSEDSEDGIARPTKSTVTSSATPSVFQRHDDGHRSKRVQRLSGLLEEPSPQRLMLEPTNRMPLSEFLTPRGPDRGDLANSQTRNGKITTKSRITDWSSVPLRDRPLETLSLEHFKVNPDYNQGYDFAFTDVVRGRDQRRCLPGCTKPGCCGDTFKKLAAGMIRTKDGHPTLSQEQENERLLEENLGANKARLQTMTREERDEMILQAKARELSNKASRHRHAFERRKSPPGFWRSDFPSTQEQADDRAEALMLERSLVQQRYEDAMRGGGAWLFRDE